MVFFLKCFSVLVVPFFKSITGQPCVGVGGVVIVNHRGISFIERLTVVALVIESIGLKVS